MSSYDLGGEIASLAIRNNFTETVNRACKHLGGAMKPFCFCATPTQQSHEVLDLTQSVGLDDKETTLFNEVVATRMAMVATTGTYVSKLTDITKKALFIDYLLSVSVCYIETPKYTAKGGVRQPTFDKFLVTKNLRLISQWTGEPLADLQYKYRDKLSTSMLDYQVGELRYVKLLSSAKGTSVSYARSPLKVADLICVPLFALNAFMRGIEPSLRDGIVEFTFLKDNNTERVLPTTLSQEIMMDYYKDSVFVQKMWSGVAIFDNEVGGMTLSSKQSRGYVKLPEIGSSKYDSNGTRSLNVARILNIRKVDSVDRMFIDVDLNSVISAFSKCLDELYLANKEEIKPMVEQLIGQPIDDKQGYGMISEQATAWVNDQNMLLTTSFKRYLHKFMVENEKWFPSYTGLPFSTDGTGALPPSFNFGV